MLRITHKILSKRHIFQFYLMLEKLQGVVFYENLDIILVFWILKPFIHMMQKAFGNECMSKSRIKEWYNRFKGGRISVDSNFLSGRPSTTKTLDNIERVRLAIEGDRRLSARELENDLGIPKTTVWEILNKILGMTRVCASSPR